MSWTMNQVDDEECVPINNSLIRKLRQERRLSQEEVAHKVGISAKTLAMFENGNYDSISSHDRISRCKNLAAIAQYYGLSGWKSLTGLAEQDENGPRIGSEFEPPGCGYNSKWYVPRPAQQADMLQALSISGVPAILQGASGMGKSQLCGWLNHNLQQRRAPDRYERSLTISLTTFETEDLGHFGHLLVSMGRRILRACNVERAEERLAAAWQRPGGEKDKLTWLMEQYILPQEGLLLLCLEQVDVLWGLPTQSDFFALLRLWMEDPSLVWSRLRLVVSVSLEPALLDSTDHSGFFSRTPPIVLPEFDSNQLGHLAQLHRIGLTAYELDTLVAWVGGHPYLSRLAMYRAVRSGVSVAQVLECAERRQQAFRGHLLRVQHWLEAHPSCRQALEYLLQGHSKPVSSEDYARLYRRGLLGEESIPGRLRYRLYDTHLRPLLNA